MKYGYLILFATVALFVSGCTTGQAVKQNVDLQIAPASNPSPESGTKTFDLQPDDQHLNPPVLVVNKGDTVHLNVLLKSPTYLSLGPYVSDYFTTGSIVFSADQSGEFVLECNTCPTKNAAYLVVR